jgi:hypothetical protein
MTRTHSEWVIFTSNNVVIAIGGEEQRLVATRTGDFHGDSSKRRIFDNNTEFFHGRDQIVVIVLTTQDGRKKSRNRMTLDLRSFMKPNPVRTNTDINFPDASGLPRGNGRERLFTSKSE